MKHSALRSRKASDSGRAESVPVIYNKIAEIIAQRGKQDVDVKGCEFVHEDEISASGHIGRPFIKRRQEGKLSWHIETLACDRNSRSQVEIREAMLASCLDESRNFSTRKIPGPAQHPGAGIVDDKCNHGMQGISAGNGAGDKLLHDITAASIGNFPSRVRQFC